MTTLKLARAGCTLAAAACLILAGAIPGRAVDYPNNLPIQDGGPDIPEIKNVQHNALLTYYLTGHDMDSLSDTVQFKDTTLSIRCLGMNSLQTDWTVMPISQLSNGVRWEVHGTTRTNGISVVDSWEQYNSGQNSVYTDPVADYGQRVTFGQSGGGGSPAP